MIDLICGNCLDWLSDRPENSIDLTITSPPYDNIRKYNGIEFTDETWKRMLLQLHKVTKQGGIVVWIVGDATIKGSETGTSFKQALYAKDIGFNLHDTMIYQKYGSGMPHKAHRYGQSFEYMFILSKGTPTHGQIKRYPKTGVVKPTTRRNRDGSITKGTYNVGGRNE